MDEDDFGYWRYLGEMFRGFVFGWGWSYVIFGIVYLILCDNLVIFLY